MLGVFRLAAAITTLVLVAIIAYVVVNGLPHISLDFIFGWPHGVNAEGGIWPTIVSTIYVTALAMSSLQPIAVLAAVYLAEYASRAGSSTPFAMPPTRWPPCPRSLWACLATRSLSRPWVWGSRCSPPRSRWHCSCCPSSCAPPRRPSARFPATSAGAPTAGCHQVAGRLPGGSYPPLSAASPRVSFWVSAAPSARPPSVAVLHGPGNQHARHAA